MAQKEKSKTVESSTSPEKGVIDGLYIPRRQTSWLTAGLIVCFLLVFIGAYNFGKYRANRVSDLCFERFKVDNNADTVEENFGK